MQLALEQPAETALEAAIATMVVENPYVAASLFDDAIGFNLDVASLDGLFTARAAPIPGPALPLRSLSRDPPGKRPTDTTEWPNRLPRDLRGRRRKERI